MPPSCVPPHKETFELPRELQLSERRGLRLALAGSGSAPRFGLARVGLVCVGEG